VVLPGGYALDFNSVLCEELYSLRNKMGFFVAMAQGSDFLGVHPIKESFLACIAPSPDVAVLSEDKGMISSNLNILDFQAQLFEFFNLDRLIKSHVFLVSLSKDSPIP